MTHSNFIQASLGAGVLLLMALSATPAFSAEDACSQSLTYNPDFTTGEIEAFEAVAYRVDKPPRHQAAACDDTYRSEFYSYVDDETENDAAPINLLSGIEETTGI